ncbi:hypothetical protein BDR07DRAFT_1414387, partial [Suillus spraguei]
MKCCRLFGSYASSVMCQSGLHTIPSIWTVYPPTMYTPCGTEVRRTSEYFMISGIYKKRHAYLIPPCCCCCFDNIYVCQSVRRLRLNLRLDRCGTMLPRPDLLVGSCQWR